jgi:protein-S-isoprenylcysteine O-methyltransferase Ste14
MKYIIVIELAILITMVLIRSAMLRKKGINAIVFGDTDETDFFILPIVLCFFYATFAPIFNLPMIEILQTPIWNSYIINYLAITICTICLIWFAITLKIFGNSFRVGIDENTIEKLITTGTFALSRNPIYITFVTFFFGVFISYPTIVTILFLIFLSTVIHRQVLLEEKFLKSHYGKEFEEYSANVRRYI